MDNKNTPAVNRPSPAVMVTRPNLLRYCTHYYLTNIANSQKDIADVVSELQNFCNDEIELSNMILPKGRKMRYLSHLTMAQIADVMLKLYVIVLVSWSEHPETDDRSRLLLCTYQTDGPLKGTYQSFEDIFNRTIYEIDYELTPGQYNLVLKLLRARAEIRQVCSDKDLIAVNNGIFDYKQKKLLPFDPEFVFLSKSFVNYNEHARNIVLHNNDDNTDWDVENWMDELSDDPEVVELLWQILGAIIRPHVHWDKAAWFYSESGSNGKGTLCELMRQLCGASTQVSLPLQEMGVEFKLEPLLHASAIITDENDVGTYIDKAANLKAIVTGDTMQVNRKFKTPVTFAFHGFMVQCLNEMPRIRDKSNSFFRRQLFIPFTKCFTGKERKYIKHDYLKRKEVLEYVLYKVLNMNYYELDVPESCKKALDEYKEYVDPIRAFLKEMLPQFVWDLLPWEFLYDLYCAWYKRNNAGTNNGIVGKSNFIKDVKRIVGELYGDDWDKTKGVMRPGKRMVMPEPLIAEYDLEKWMNQMYLNSKDVDKKCLPVLNVHYRGLYRIGQTAAVSAPDDVS